MRILFYVDNLDNTKGQMLGVNDEVFGTDVYKDKLIEEVNHVLGDEPEPSAEIKAIAAALAADHKAQVEYKEYIFFYEDVEVFTIDTSLID